MLKFVRNKLVSVQRKDQDNLLVQGILDDDIYSLELRVSVRISDLEILAIQGKWNRWTTPECQRAIRFLQQAVGYHIEDEGFSRKIHKTIGRKACRHHANLLIECCDAAKQAAMLAGWEDEKAKNESLTFEQFVKGDPKDGPEPAPVSAIINQEQPLRKDQDAYDTVDKNVSGGMIIDLHAHTSPASPCSSAPVDRLIEEAKGIGLDGICLTDHNYAWEFDLVEDLRQKHGFLVLRGNEITTDQGHMLVFGLDKPINGIIRLEDLREDVLKEDGFIIVPHPFRGFLTFGVGHLGLTWEKAMERPLFKWVDAVEVMNGKVTEKENRFASKVAAGLGLRVTGGSDAHAIGEVGVYATRFSEVIKDDDGLIKALQNGSYAPIAFRKEPL